MEQNTAFLKPGSAILVLVDGAWVSGPMMQATVKTIILEGEEAFEETHVMAQAGVFVLGELRRCDFVPGLTLKLTGFQGRKITQPVEIVIPWNYVTTIVTHENWAPKELEKRYGFAVESAKKAELAKK